MSFNLCPQCKSIFVLSKTGNYCDNCYYGATKEQEVITTKWNEFSEKRIKEQKLKEHESVFNQMSEEQFSSIFSNVTYDDYYEPSKEQIELEELKQRIKNLQQEIPPEFEETFRKRFRDILA